MAAPVGFIRWSGGSRSTLHVDVLNLSILIKSHADHILSHVAGKGEVECFDAVVIDVAIFVFSPMRAEFKQIKDSFRSRPRLTGMLFPVCRIKFLKVMGHEKTDAGILVAFAHCLLYGEQCGLSTSPDFPLVWFHVSIA